MAVLAGWLTLPCLLNGCGRPAGPVFSPIEPPIVWPPPPEPPYIKLVGTLSGSHDLHATQSGSERFKAVLRGSRPPIKFSGPNMIAIGPAGLLAVSDSAGGVVHLVDLEQRTHRVVAGWDDERFAVPIGVAWAGNRLFVTDAQRHEVIELDAQGRFRQRFASQLLVRPVGIAYVAGQDRLCVVDGGSHHLVMFDLNGTQMSVIGQRGTAPGMFNFPSHICSRGDRLVVADSGNARVQVLGLDGASPQVIGKKGDGAGDLSLPKGVAFDSEGHIYVVDAHFENVQIYDEQGRLLLAFGHEGTGLGEFSLPAGLTIDDKDRIWVADSANHRLQVFQYLRARP